MYVTSFTELLLNFDGQVVNFWSIPLLLYYGRDCVILFCSISLPYQFIARLSYILYVVR